MTKELKDRQLPKTKSKQTIEDRMQAMEMMLGILTERIRLLLMCHPQIKITTLGHWIDHVEGKRHNLPSYPTALAICIVMSTIATIIALVALGLAISNQRQKENNNAQTAVNTASIDQPFAHQERALAFFDSASAFCAMRFASSATSTCLRTSSLCSHFKCSFSSSTASSYRYWCPILVKPTRFKGQLGYFQPSGIACTYLKQFCSLSMLKLYSLTESVRSISIGFSPSAFSAISSRILSRTFLLYTVGTLPFSRDSVNIKITTRTVFYPYCQADFWVSNADGAGKGKSS